MHLFHWLPQMAPQILQLWACVYHAILATQTPTAIQFNRFWNNNDRGIHVTCLEVWLCSPLLYQLAIQTCRVELDWISKLKLYLEVLQDNASTSANSISTLFHIVFAIEYAFALMDSGSMNLLRKWVFYSGSTAFLESSKNKMLVLVFLLYRPKWSLNWMGNGWLCLDS